MGEESEEEGSTFKEGFSHLRARERKLKIHYKFTRADSPTHPINEATNHLAGRRVGIIYSHRMGGPLRCSGGALRARPYCLLGTHSSSLVSSLLYWPGCQGSAWVH